MRVPTNFYYLKKKKKKKKKKIFKKKNKIYINLLKKFYKLKN